jgi:hypothetical protein
MSEKTEKTPKKFPVSRVALRAAEARRGAGPGWCASQVLALGAEPEENVQE